MSMNNWPVVTLEECLARAKATADKAQAEGQENLTRSSEGQVSAGKVASQTDIGELEHQSPLDLAKSWLHTIIEESRRIPDEPTAEKGLEHMMGRIEHLAITALEVVERREREAK